MQTARFVAILAMIMIAAGATIALAFAWAQMGGPVWQAVIGPLLLIAVLAVHWMGKRK